MRYFCYEDTSGFKVYSEEDIRKEYYPYWSEKMKSIGKESEINFEDCLDDWITIHWAWESKNE